MKEYHHFQYLPFKFEELTAECYEFCSEIALLYFSRLKRKK